MKKDLIGKTILVASGGTQEYIDDVRYMTNVSTGKLGAKLVEVLVARGAKVQHVRTKGSVEAFPIHESMEVRPLFACHKGRLRIKSHEVRSARDAMRVLKNLLKRTKIDAVIMTMAVADWGFKKSRKKLSSDSKEDFMAFLDNNMIRNPKIIEQIKEWSPQTVLVGFKFMVDYGTDNLIRLARDKLKTWNADIVVANDKAEMKREGAHVAYLVRPRAKPIKVAGKDEITDTLIEKVSAILSKAKR